MTEKVFSFAKPVQISSRWLGNAAKRALDIVVSLVMLILLAPFMGLIGLALKRDSSGPVFYHGRRLGMHGRVFKILKFRTMYETADSYAGPKVTAHDDTRITPLGGWLRDTKLNELPQFWNVLIGDMSLVGPRPEDPDIAREWPKEIWNEVTSVRPGITSPASVQYHDEESLLHFGDVLQKYVEELGPDKMRLDQLYVRYRSFLLDLDTLFWTFMILLPRIGAEPPPEEFLFVGPFTRLIRRYVNWFMIDLLVTLSAIAISGLVWRSFGALNAGWPRSLAMSLAFSLVFSLIGAVFGINRISWAKAGFIDGYDLLPSWALATVLIYFANTVLHVFPARVIISASLLALVGYVTVRFRSRLLSATLGWLVGHFTVGAAGRERVLIVGAGAAAQHAAWLLSHPSNIRKYWVVGFVDDDMFKQGMRIYGSTVVGMVKDIPELVTKYDVGIVIMAVNRSWVGKFHPAFKLCQQAKAKFVVLPDLLAIFNGLVNSPSTVPLSASMIPVTSNTESGANEEKALIDYMTRFISEDDEAQPDEQAELERMEE